MNCFNYVLLDPRFPGKYQYSLFSFFFKPFYVGKGSGKRLQATIKSGNKLKMKTIKNIKEQGLSPIIVKLNNNISQYKALNCVEPFLINDIGKITTSEGPLTNMTNGGEGHFGLKKSKETRNKISKSKLGKKRKPFSDEWKLNMSKAQNNSNHRPIGTFKHSKKTKKRMSSSRRGSNNANANSYIFIDPYKNTYEVVGSFQSFCKEHNLSIKRISSNINLEVITKKSNYEGRTESSRNCEGWQINKI